ncbi:CAP domain-containing protein [Terrimonas sp.]|uniref:CAP domain-containing protein n=1 Tax=Terrimonas sp. TaxID=1914338 RepID=UPI001403FEEB|nr:CAP domain-containing protein [Terrimonas sp.]
MKRLLSVFIACAFISFVHSQGSIVLRDAPFIVETEKDASIQQWLDSNAFYKKLSPDQQESIYWINYIRKYPKLFHDKILIPFLEQFPEAKSAYSKSLSATLISMSPVGLLIPDENLTKVAIEHATDLGKHGAGISHSSTSGSSFQERMNKAGYFSNVAENIYEGKRSSLEALIFLLIDTGVKSVGHRKNILSIEMKRVGLSFYPIKGRPGMFFLVQDFSGE